MPGAAPFLLSLLLAAPAAAETVRVATWDVGLTRDGAGVLLRDLGRPPEPALAGVLAVIREVRPDVLLLTGFDTDRGGRALTAFRGLLGARARTASTTRRRSRPR